MELIMIPQALLVLYGFLVLGCGSALGVHRGPQPPEAGLSARSTPLARPVADPWRWSEVTMLIVESGIGAVPRTCRRRKLATH